MKTTSTARHISVLYTFFWAITRRPKTVLMFGLVLLVTTAGGLVKLVKDTSTDAFIPLDHPSVLANEFAKETFGLSDPIVIALVADESIFSPGTLQYIARVHHAIADLPNVRDDRVTSLASESSIVGQDNWIDVQPYIAERAALGVVDEIRKRWREMPPHIGTLVSDDERGAVIIAELIDQQHAGETYEAVAAIFTDLPDGIETHIAGQGAVVGYLSNYIDADSRLLQPMIFLIVLMILFGAFRTVAAVGLPLVVIIGSAGGALGIMASSSISYFAITSALPVILVAIAVADAVHILTAYYVRRSQDDTTDVRAVVVDTMVNMSRPITLTTLTTIAGFIGIAVAEIMPPVVYFAWFAAIGVFLAWLYSLVVLPCMMVLMQPKPSPAFTNWSSGHADIFARTFTRIGSVAARFPIVSLAVLALVAMIALFGASNLRVDRALVEGFKPDAAIRIADTTINQQFAGTAFLDVMVSTPEEEGLLTTNAMEKIRDLQVFMETLPRVQHTVAITDYLSLLHQAMFNTQVQQGERPLPTQDEAISQYLLVYEASADPTDFEEEIDLHYQNALVRGVLNTRYFSEERATVEAMDRYLAEQFNTPSIQGTLSGRVNVRYHWMVRLAEHHALGVGLCLMLVLGISAMLFRSASAGIVSVLPVSATVLCLYGVMGALGIFLEPATTMFAAISLGVGVDFAIHLVARLKQALANTAGDVQSAINIAMPETSRACFFNALALGVGFSVLLFSELLTLKRFGGMVAVASTASFLMALVIVPAIYGIRERFKLGRAPDLQAAN